MPSRAAVASWPAMMPIPGLRTRPFLMRSGTTRFTTSTGTAKPMPALAPEGEKMAVLTPIRRPAESSSGPPELPGLIAASVWITPDNSRPSCVGRRRCSALMTPLVNVWSSPNGLPMAKADCPTLRSAELPTASGGGILATRPSWSTARS